MKTTGPHPGWQERTIQLLGHEKHARLERSNVLVAGMGGVGSMAAEMICRCGVGKMTIIDGDTIQPGNLNRQIPATHSKLGREKAAVMGERLLDINPGLQLAVLNEFIRDERIPGILEESFDYVVDAIDTLAPKIYLIHSALTKGLKLASSMGSGGKTDPSRVTVADFSETYNCRLAYILRKKLRKLDIHGGFKVVFSTEQVPRETIIPVKDEPNKKSTAGTCSYIPAIFGCMLASIVIIDLAGLPGNG
jgi:tRNA A37 threonylcarbamoyladenosine dehydratase